MKHADEYTSYEFLKEHLYDKPHLYEASFRKVKPYAVILQSFESLRQLMALSGRNKDIGDRIKKDLMQLDRLYRWLRPQIVEVLMFVLWDDLTLQYGRGESFKDSYWDLINELENQPPLQDKQITQIKSDR